MYSAWRWKSNQTSEPGSEELIWTYIVLDTWPIYEDGAWVRGSVTRAQADQGLYPIIEKYTECMVINKKEVNEGIH